MIDTKELKKDFPILSPILYGREYIYLDNAATTQKPKAVIDAISEFYSRHNASVGRSSHFLADVATDKYDEARATVAQFLNVPATEIVFTKNATEALNMVAFGFGSVVVSAGDTILTTSSGHNSSLLPWLALAESKQAHIEYLEVSKTGELATNWADKLKTGVKVVLLEHVSNVLGSILPLEELCRKAHDIGAVVVVDGSQAVGHVGVLDLTSLGCDFYAFSGHKLYGPLGIGVLWAKSAHLAKMEPIMFGGGTVKNLTVEGITLRDIPERFEAGTPNTAGAVGLAAAIKYLSTIGIQEIYDHEHIVTTYAYTELAKLAKVELLGPSNPDNRASLVSFLVGGVHSHDIGSILNTENIAVRSGMHCSLKLYDSLKLPASTRASFALYNDKHDVDCLVEGVKKALQVLT